MIVNKYADAPELEALAARIKRLRRELRESARGAPQTEVEYDSIIENVMPDVGNETNRKALKELYRPLYRTLSQMYHPDRPTGNALLFRQIATAYRQGNYPFLEEVYYTRAIANHPYKRSTVGFEYTKKMLENAHQRFELLRNLPEFEVVLAHKRGDKQRALVFTTVILTNIAQDLETEVTIARFNARMAERRFAEQ